MDLTAILVAFTKDMIEIVRAVMDSPYGINDKVHKNTLNDSNVYKQLTAKVTHDGDLIFDLMLNDYIRYIESGRRAGAKFPPVEPIVKWARQHGIQTDNSTIVLIRRAISRDGISPRPIMAVVFDELDKKWDKDWADELFDEIMRMINDFFNV